ncbi:MAG TPA: hypothetical protein VGM51_06055 [Armatimonadota bacterium]
MVRLHSRLLGEDIICVEDGQKSPEEPGIVCYTRGELAALKGLDPAAVKAVHRAKKHFGGKYIGPSPAGG